MGLYKISQHYNLSILNCGKNTTQLKVEIQVMSHPRRGWGKSGVAKKSHPTPGGGGVKAL